MDVEREKSIGARLRAFRETLQIPRTKFAFTVGYGSEQFAAYESGRARLPYQIFHHITRHYFLNPFWLAMGDDGGSPRLDSPFDDNAFVVKVLPRALFTEVYDDFISNLFNQYKEAEQIKLKAVRKYLIELRVRMAKSPNPPDSVLADEIQEFQRFASGLKDRCDLDFRISVEKHLRKNNDLTKTAMSSNIVGVKPLWPALKRRLQSATAENGKKSELAKFLKMDLTRISQWLTDAKSAREPGAEYALQMLHWVEQQERQK